MVELLYKKYIASSIAWFGKVNAIISSVNVGGQRRAQFYTYRFVALVCLILDQRCLLLLFWFCVA